MKKFIFAVLVVAIVAFSSCKKENILPAPPDLSQYTLVDIVEWKLSGGPMKLDYYIQLDVNEYPVHAWPQVVDQWLTSSPFFPAKYVYVYTTDYKQFKIGF